MGEIIKKFKIFWMWEFEEEEEWLNNLAKDGLELIATPNPILYHFKKSDKITKVRIEYLQGKSSIEKADYIEFVESTGAKHIKGNKGWHYFKKSINDDFDIYSDNTSKVGFLNRILKPLGWIALTNLIIGIVNPSFALIMQASLGAFPMALMLGASITNILIGVFGIIGYKKLKEKKERLEEKSSFFENEI